MAGVLVDATGGERHATITPGLGCATAVGGSDAAPARASFAAEFFGGVRRGRSRYRPGVLRVARRGEGRAGGRHGKCCTAGRPRLPAVAPCDGRRRLHRAGGRQSARSRAGGPRPEHSRAVRAVAHPLSRRRRSSPKRTAARVTNSSSPRRLMSGSGSDGNRPVAADPCGRCSRQAERRGTRCEPLRPPAKRTPRGGSRPHAFLRGETWLAGGRRKPRRSRAFSGCRKKPRDGPAGVGLVARCVMESSTREEKTSEHAIVCGHHGEMPRDGFLCRLLPGARSWRRPPCMEPAAPTRVGRVSTSGCSRQ